MTVEEERQDKSALPLNEIEKALRSNVIPNRIWHQLTQYQKDKWVERITA